MGRKINSNWKEGGGDNLEIRKRMLLRELTKLRGKLLGKVTELQTKLEAYLSYAQNFERVVSLKIPMTEQQLTVELSKFPVDLAEILKPYTFDEMDPLVNHQLRDKRNAVFQNIKQANDDVIRTTLDQSLQKTVHKAKIMVDLAVRRAVQTAIGNIKSSAPENFDMSIIQSIEKVLIFKASVCCNTFKNAKFIDNCEEPSPVKITNSHSPIKSDEEFKEKAIEAAGNLVSSSLKEIIETVVSEFKESNPRFLPASLVQDLERDLQYKQEQCCAAFVKAEYDLRNNP